MLEEVALPCIMKSHGNVELLIKHKFRVSMWHVKSQIQSLTTASLYRAHFFSHSSLLYFACKETDFCNFVNWQLSIFLKGFEKVCQKDFFFLLGLWKLFQVFSVYFDKFQRIAWFIESLILTNDLFWLKGSKNKRINQYKHIKNM